MKISQIAAGLAASAALAAFAPGAGAADAKALPGNAPGASSRRVRGRGLRVLRGSEPLPRAY